MGSADVACVGAAIDDPVVGGADIDDAVAELDAAVPDDVAALVDPAGAPALVLPEPPVAVVAQPTRAIATTATPTPVRTLLMVKPLKTFLPRHRTGPP